MIVKNEEAFLRGCLESARGLVDEMIVVDTGSTDHTLDIAREFGVSLHHFQWIDDFSAARNESIRHARGEWILYLDADERIDGLSMRDCVRTTAASGEFDAYSVPIRSLHTEENRQDPRVSYNIRLFKRLPGIHFTGEVHERVEPFLESVGASIGRAPFFIDHLGYNADPETLMAKLRRNHALTLKHLKRNPEDAYALYYLGLTLIQLKEHQEALGAFRDALSHAGENPHFRALILNMAACSHLLLGEYAPSVAMAKESLSLIQGQNTAHILLGLAAYEQKQYGGAIPHLKRACEFLALPPERRETDLSHEQSANETVLLQALSDSLIQLNRHAEAIPVLMRKMETGATDPDTARTLGICLLNSGDDRRALPWLEKALRGGAALPLVGPPLAYAYFRHGRLDDAMNLFLRTNPATPADADSDLKLLALMAARKELHAQIPAAFEKRRNHLTKVDPSTRADLAAAFAEHGFDDCFEATIATTFGIRGSSELAAILNHWLKSNNDARAIPLLMRLRTRLGDHPQILDALGTFAIRCGKLPVAVESYLAMHRAVPDHPLPPRRLTGLFARMGNLEAARQWHALVRE